MTGLRKFAISGVLMIVLFIAGFMFLLRGCLSRYDERSAIMPALYFENNGKPAVLCIVKYDKATSYSQHGGFVSKTVSTDYFLQVNDGATGSKILDKKIKHHSDIKHHPIQTIGMSGNNAWVFIGELMAFNVSNLEKTADIASLEAKNPSLKGKFPEDRRYYVYDKETHDIHITANDGTGWILNTNTMIASSSSEMAEGDDEDKDEDRIEKLIKQIYVQQDTLYQQYNVRPGRLYSAGKLSYEAYHASQQKYFDGRKLLDKQRDSLQKIQSRERTLKQNAKAKASKLESLERNVYFSQMKVNQDTLSGEWLGMYAKKEIEELYDRVQAQPAYDETARRQLYKSSYGAGRNEDYLIDLNNARLISGNQFFLQGGFLLDKNTGDPLRPGKKDYLVVHKDKIGNEGRILVSRVGDDGQTKWTLETGLKEWADYNCNGKYLYIFGLDNKELSGSDTNLLMCIDLLSGRAAKYDYFTDKK